MDKAGSDHIRPPDNGRKEGTNLVEQPLMFTQENEGQGHMVEWTGAVKQNLGAQDALILTKREENCE